MVIQGYRLDAVERRTLSEVAGDRVSGSSPPCPRKHITPRTGLTKERRAGRRPEQGHTIQVNYDPGSTILVEGISYASGASQRGWRSGSQECWSARSRERIADRSEVGDLGRGLVNEQKVYNVEEAGARS